MDLSIVIVNYNVKHFLRQCLQSILDSTEIAHYKMEVWVVDNASIDRSVEMVKEEFPDVKLITNNDNVGFSKANNQAIRASNGKYILLLNPDTILSENTLHLCLEAMNSDSKIGALGVKMIDGSGKFLTESKRGLPSVWNSFCKLSGLSALFKKVEFLNGYTLSYLPENEEADIDVLCGAFMFMPKSVLDEAGLLDERFFMYGEDIDLSYRIQQAGYKIKYFPDTNIIHFKGESTKKGSFSYVKIFYEAMILYVKKHYTGTGSLIFVFALKMAILLRAGLSLIKRLLASSWLPILDLGIIYTIGVAATSFWANYNFNNSDYYSNTPILINLIIASCIFVFGLLIVGAYNKLHSLKRQFSGLIIGTLCVLAIYGLLDSQYRSSRAILLLMGFGAYLTLPILHRWLSAFQIDQSRKKVLIIGNENNGNSIKSSIESLNNDLVEVVGLIHPNPEINTHAFVNSINNIDEIVQVLKVNEIIFSKQDISMEKIMTLMSKIKSSVDFKIGGDDLLTFIGSRDKNANGQIYSIDITFNLSKENILRQKRILDIILCIPALILSPISYILKRLQTNVWKDIFDVFKGEKTWVGYNHFQNHQLPELNSCVIDLSDNFDHTGLVAYAKEYSPSMDIFPFIKNLFK